MKLPPKALLERQIGLRGTFYEFVEMAFEHVETGETFVGGEHIEQICRHLELKWKGEIEPDIAIPIPPGCMKSLLVSVLWVVWVWIHDPSIRFSNISYDAELTGTRDGGKVVKLIQSPWFQERWGDRVMIPTDPAKSNIETQGGGFRFATSIRGKYTGRHVHFEIVDDPTNPAQMTKAALEEVQTWRTRVAPTRLLPREKGTPGGRVYIMQRLHEDDMIGKAELEEKANPGTWIFLRFPMEFEVKNPCRTQWGGDWRTVEGQLLWPARFSPEEVEKRKRKLGPKNTASQFQQRPVPDGGLIFSGDTFKYYKVAPAKFEEIVISVDATFKDAATSDLVCMGVWGRKGGEFYLLDVVWRRMSFTASIEALKSLVRKWPRARTKLIEDKANGSAIIDTLKRTISGIVPVNPEGGKEARANAVEPYFVAGNVFFPDPDGAITQPDKQNEPEVFSWVEELKAELTGFPFAAHDDGVDMLSQALLYMGTKLSRFVEAMKKLKGKSRP